MDTKPRCNSCYHLRKYPEEYAKGVIGVCELNPHVWTDSSYEWAQPEVCAFEGCSQHKPAEPDFK